MTQGTCEQLMSERDWPEGHWCGRPATMRYPAMGGGFMHLCDDHGAKHTRIVDQFGQRWNGHQWVAESPS